MSNLKEFHGVNVESIVIMKASGNSPSACNVSAAYD
jgi:hypothetical protein